MAAGVFTHTDNHTVYDLPDGHKLCFSTIRVTNTNTATATPLNITPLKKVISWALAYDTSNAAGVTFTTSGFVTTSGASQNMIFATVAAAANNAVFKIISFGV
jgi:hypothetical protein